jgi:ketosteroid isomerase-like protein
MKNKIIIGILLTYAMTFLIACSPKKAETIMVDKEQIKKDIQAKENEFADTYNSHELKNIGYYAEDAISFSQNKPPLVGKVAIIEYFKSGLNSTNMSNKLTFTTLEVYVSDTGNQVLEVGYYKVVDSTNTPVNTGHYMSLFVKRNGRYVCLRDMSTSDMPVE